MGYIDGHLPDLDALELFLAVSETGSVGGAARRQGISQPTASGRLRLLERRLGLVLLERHPTGSRLTDDGRRVAQWADDLVGKGRRFSQNVAALSRKQGSRLRVAASLTIADHLLPAWLVALADAEPEVTVSLQPANSDRVAELVRTGQVDVGFVEGAAAPEGLQAAVVGHDDLVVVVAPTHEWARAGTRLGVADLVTGRLVMREEGSGTRQVLESALEPLGVGVTPVMELGSTSLIIRAVVGGRGAAIVSRLVASDDLAEGRLVAVAVEGISLRRDLLAVWQPGTAPRGAAASLLRLVGERRTTSASQRSAGRGH